MNINVDRLTVLLRNIFLIYHFVGQINVDFVDDDGNQMLHINPKLLIMVDIMTI